MFLRAEHPRTPPAGPAFDPIRWHPHGPCGIRDVAGPLDELSRRWDDDLARDLFRERLHHQEDLYPATYAALPWIWEHSPDRLSDPAGGTFPFLFHILPCAKRTGGMGCVGTGPRGGFRGLSTRVEDHEWPRPPPEQRLRARDMENLARLKDWFAGTAPIIAEASLAAISGQDRFLDALFLRAVTAWRVAEVLVEACSMWSGGHDMTTILDEAPWPSDKDRRILPDIAPDRGMAAGRGGVRSGVGGRPARGAGLTTAMGRSEASSRPEQAASGTIGGPLGLDRDRPLSLCEAA